MIIIKDGSYKLRDNKFGGNADKTVVYASGKFGGANAVLAYANSSGEFVPLINGTVQSGGQYIVYDGGAITIYVLVSGAVEGTTAIDIISEGVS